MPEWLVWLGGGVLGAGGVGGIVTAIASVFRDRRNDRAVEAGQALEAIRASAQESREDLKLAREALWRAEGRIDDLERELDECRKQKGAGR